MSLVLEVVRHGGLAPAAPRQARFGEAGGGIGRNPANALVLDDPSKEISNFHAAIRHADGQYVYEDKSTNGSELGKADGRWIALHAQSAALDDGDALKIGQYELRVRLEAEPAAAGAAALEALYEEAAASSQPAAQEETGEDMEDFWGEGPMPTERRPAPAPEIPVAAAAAAPLPPFGGAGESALKTVAQPNIAVAAEPAQVRQEPEPMAAQPSVPHPPKPAQDADAALFRGLLKAAGLECPAGLGLAEQQHAAHTLGLVFRLMLDGAMAQLRARTAEKYEIRAGVTRIGQQYGNPLKLPSAEAAMKVMLFPERYGDPNYLAPKAAVQESFSDLSNHSLAMRKAMQSALASILERFDPAAFASPAGQGMLPFRDAKSWKAYRAAYPGLCEEATEGLFSGVFAKVYEETVRSLHEGDGNH